MSLPNLFGCPALASRGCEVGGKSWLSLLVCAELIFHGYDAGGSSLAKFAGLSGAGLGKLGWLSL